MIKYFSAAGAMLLVSGLTPASAHETMSVLNDGAKLKVVYPAGDTLSVEFKSDGTFATNDGRTGTWTLDGDTLCQQVSSDDTEGCTTLAPDKKVGDTWEMVDIFGNNFTATLE